MAPVMRLKITIQNRERILDPIDKLALETVREALLQHRIATKHRSRRATRVSSHGPLRKMGRCLDARFSRLSMPSTVSDDQENGVSTDLDRPLRTAHVCDSVSTPRRKLRKLEYVKTIVSCKNLPRLACGGNNPRALMNMVNRSDRSQCQDMVNRSDRSQCQDMVNHSDRSQCQDMVNHSDRSQCQDMVNHSDRSRCQDMVNRSDRSQCQDMVNHSDRSQCQDMVNHSDRSQCQDMVNRSDRSQCQDMVNRSDRSQCQDMVNHSDISQCPDMVNHSDRSQCQDMVNHSDRSQCQDMVNHSDISQCQDMVNRSDRSQCQDMVNHSDRSQCQDMVNHSDRSQCQDMVNHSDISQCQDMVNHSDRSQCQDIVNHSDRSQCQDMVNHSDRSQCQDMVNHSDISQGHDTNVAVIKDNVNHNNIAQRQDTDVVVLKDKVNHINISQGQDTNVVLKDKVNHSNISQGQATNVVVPKDKVNHSNISQGQDANVAVLKDNANHSNISQGQDTSVVVPKDMVNHSNISQGQDTYVAVPKDKVNDSEISQGQDTDVPVADVAVSIGDVHHLGSDNRSECLNQECYTISDEDSPMVGDQSVQNKKNSLAGSSIGRHKDRVFRSKPLAKSPCVTKVISTGQKSISASDSLTTNVLAKGRYANLIDVIVISDSESDDDIAESSKVPDKTLPACSSDSVKDGPQPMHGRAIAENIVMIESETNVVGDTTIQKANDARGPKKDVATKSRDIAVPSKEGGNADVNLPCEEAGDNAAENEKVVNVSKTQSGNSLCGLEEIRSGILAELEELFRSQPAGSPVSVRSKTAAVMQSVQRGANKENTAVAKVHVTPVSATEVTHSKNDTKISCRNNYNGNAAKSNLNKPDPVTMSKGKVADKTNASVIVATTKVAQKQKSGAENISRVTHVAGVKTNASGIVATKIAQKHKSRTENISKVTRVAGVKTNASGIAQKHKSGVENISKVIHVAGVKTNASGIVATKISEKHKSGTENTPKEKGAVKTNSPGNVATNLDQRQKSVIARISTGKVASKTSPTGIVRTIIVAQKQKSGQEENLSCFPEKRRRQIPARKSISSVMRARSKTPVARAKGDKLAMDNDDYVYFRFSGEECIHRNLFCGRSESNAELTLRLELLNGEIKRRKTVATDSDDVARKQLSVELEVELLQSWLLYHGVGQVVFLGHPLPATLQLGSDVETATKDTVMLLERVPTVEEYGKLYDLRQTLETSRKLHTLGIKGTYKNNVLNNVIFCYLSQSVIRLVASFCRHLDRFFKPTG